MSDIRTFWLSFADEEEGFLGVNIIDMTPDELEGVEAGREVIPVAVKCLDLGINPGGEILMSEVPQDDHIPEHFKNRLLDKAEADLARGKNTKSGADLLN